MSICNEHAKPSVSKDVGWKRRFRRRLLNWYRATARPLPWRENHDPYRVWVSEIMLQQTQVETVIEYFRRFLKAFPTVSDLAAADEQKVLRHWEGLGYYRRARQLHAAARIVVEKHAGQFPRDYDNVLALPGIGKYTAGAILSIAHDAREPILEANTIRLLSRLLLFRGDPTSGPGLALLWSFADEILPRKNCGDFNQALMELGALICTPKAPRCETCPVAMLCPTRSQSLQSEIPRPKKKKVFQDVREVAIVVLRRGNVLLRRYEKGGRWAGLWDFPRFAPKKSRGDDLQGELSQYVRDLSGLTVTDHRRITTIKHGVTRYRITLDCYLAGSVSGRLKPGELKSAGRHELQWISLRQLDDFPLCTTGRQLGNMLESLDFSAFQILKAPVTSTK